MLGFEVTARDAHSAQASSTAIRPSAPLARAQKGDAAAYGFGHGRTGALPRGGRQGRPLRELLHQGLPAGRRPGDLDPPHGPQAPRAEPNASIWFVLFDREADGPRATKVTVPAAELSAPAGSWIRVADAEIGPGRAEGSVETEALRPPGTSTFAGDAEPCKYLPADWLYEAPLPRTKFVAPFPDARFEGRLEIDGETIELSGWPGMIGHNWGTEHAERWVWLEGTGFADSPDTYFDAGAARVKLGRRTSPWIPSGMLVLDGEAHRLGGLGRSARPRIEEPPTVCELRPARQGHRRPRPRLGPGRRTSSAGSTPTPKGPEHNTVNCSVADLELTVERPACRRAS